MNFRPLSSRGKPNDALDTLHEGVPPWLRDPTLSWISEFVLRGRRFNVDFLQDFQSVMRLMPPLDWSGGPGDAATDFLSRFRRHDVFALDALDYALHHISKDFSGPLDRRAHAGKLNAILRRGGSAWEVRPAPDGHNFMLSRRELGPMVDAVTRVASDAERAGAHLTEAWVRVAGRNPDPSGAYREAVRAVEAAAKPVISPNDSMATLGKMIRAIRDKPEKWTFVLEGGAEKVADLCAVLWTSQLDRHGTDDESAPLNVSQAQADAAVHLALTLVRWFTGGAFAPAQ